jgi:hypothetical protein
MPRASEETTFYVLPYFDLGVHLGADGQGGIDEASAAVHYLQPGRSSLLSRGAYTLARVRAENLRRTDPQAYAEQRSHSSQRRCSFNGRR